MSADTPYDFNGRAHPRAQIADGRARAAEKSRSDRAMHCREPELRVGKAVVPAFFGPNGPALSSRRVDWNSPSFVPSSILGALGLARFDVDPCAPSDGGGHVPAVTRYTEAENGLEQQWCGYVYVNPPYARSVTNLWVRRCRMSVETGETTLVAALLPARTGTRWCHADIFQAGAAVLFLDKRLRFGEAADPAPFDSLIAVWGATGDQMTALARAFPGAHLVRPELVGGAR